MGDTLRIGEKYQNHDNSIYLIQNIIYTKRGTDSPEDVLFLMPVKSQTTHKEVTQLRKHFEQCLRCGLWQKVIS